jgi:xanthine dehydrogenase accessory factor
MLFRDHLVVVRGGGDLGTGVGDRMRRSGFPVVVLELGAPLAVRRTVAYSTAVDAGHIEVEGITATLVGSAPDAVTTAAAGDVAVMVAPRLPEFAPAAAVVVDARLAKQRLDTSSDQAPLVVALGPGHVAGVDCHAVVETMRGHRLGRVIWDGAAAPDTGVPGTLGGAGAARVVRAPHEGKVAWVVAIGDVVEEGDALGTVGATQLAAPLSGVVRGLIAPGRSVTAGTKIGDVDPRGDPSACFEVSDKARLVGAGVLEAVLTWLGRSDG